MKRLTLEERRGVTKAFTERYRRARKKEKGLVLNEFVASTGYNRMYTARPRNQEAKKFGHGLRLEVEMSIFL